MKALLISITFALLCVCGLIVSALISLWWQRRQTRKLLRKLEGREFPPHERGDK